MSQVLDSQPITATPIDLLRLPSTLTVKQKLFIYHYLEHRNATKAARLAGYAGEDSVLGQVGYENLRKPEIRQQIDDFYQSRLASPAQILAEASEIALTPISELANGQNDAPIRAVDKLKGIELVGKHHQVWGVERVETNLSDDTAGKLAEQFFSLLQQAAAQRDAQPALGPVTTESNLPE